MSVDPVQQMVLADLRLVRRGAGLFTMDRVANAEVLVEYLGRGSVEQAYTSLLDLLDRYADDADSDIATYFYTCGHKIGGDTLDWRLTRYQEERFVQQRTALRRSDRGAVKLSHLIRDSFQNERPWGILVLRQEGDLLKSAITLAVPDGSWVRQPHIYVNGTRVEGVNFDFENEGTNPLLISSTRQLPDTLLNWNAGEDEPLASVSVYWLISVWPTWTLGARVNDDRIHAKLEVNRAGYVLAEIVWNV